MGHIRVDTPNTNNKWVGFGLANVDTIIIRVGFGLANVDTIHILTRHEHDPLTRIATPNPRSRKFSDFYQNYDFALFSEIGIFSGLTCSWRHLVVYLYSRFSHFLR